MRRPSRALRTAYLVVASLQVSLPAAAALADARLEAETVNRPAHVEQVGHGCAIIHPADCALCQFVALSYVGGGRVAVAIAVANQPSALLRNAVPPQAAAAGRLPHQRAPPLTLL
jgi:hypothetical protein